MKCISSRKELGGRKNNRFSFSFRRQILFHGLSLNLFVFMWFEQGLGAFQSQVSVDEDEFCLYVSVCVDWMRTVS